MKRMIALIILVLAAAPLRAEIALRQSTASQEIPLGYFTDSVDGDTEETELTIANTDIKLWKSGATTLTSKNSGGATHIANGIYYATLDATDTNTAGPLVVFCHPTGAGPMRVECCVYPATVYDALVAGSGTLPVNVTQCDGTTVPAPNYVCGPVTIEAGAEDTTTSVSSTGFSGDLRVGYRIVIKHHTTGVYYWRRISSVDLVAGTINWTTPLGFTPGALDTAWVFSDAPQLEDIRTAALTTIPAATTAIKAQTDKLTFDGSNHVAVQNGTGSGQVPQVSDLLGTAVPGAYGAGTLGYLVGHNLDAQVSGVSRAASAKDIEPINSSSRVSVLVPSDKGLYSQDTKTLIAGSPGGTYAIDFRNDSGANQKIYSVDNISIYSGTAGGITFGTSDDWERDGGTQVRFQPVGVTNGKYTLYVEVTYGHAGGGKGRGYVTYTVVGGSDN